MFRLPNCMVTARTLLYRRTTIDCQLVSISRSHPLQKYENPKERETCPPPPVPPPPPRKSYKLLWGTITLLFLAGGFVVYAHESAEIRDWLTINASWLDDFIATVYQENEPLSVSVPKFFNKVSKAVISSFNEDPNARKVCEDPVVIARPDPTCREESDKKAPKPRICKDETPNPPPSTNICEVEYCIKDACETVLHNYMTARDACLYYNQLVSDTMGDFTLAGGRSLKDAIAERTKLVKESLTNACEAKHSLEGLVTYLQCGMRAPKDHIKSTKLMYAEFKNKIDTTYIEFQWANDLSEALDGLVPKVLATLDAYIEENKSMFTDINYETRKPVLRGDPDLLIFHTMRYVEKLRADLNDAAETMSDRVNRAVAMFPQTDEGKKDFDEMYSKRKSDLDKDYQNRSEAQKQANEKLLKDLLQKQLDKHEASLESKLLEKDEEVTNNLNQMVAERVAAEKQLMDDQIKEMAMKLQLVEDQLEGKLKAERETRRSQELWSAGAALLATTKKGGKYVSIENEVKAIEDAVADSDDKLVLAVLKAIPKSVRKRGLVPENRLRETFHSMETIALKVALVEAEGAPLPVYLLSYLQSLLLFMKLPGIPQKEYENPPQDPPKDLDTFDLLSRARFYVDQGNIALALRYVNSLEGASRGAAESWAEAARSHLETRQAAEAVIAHAAALGLQYL